LKLEKQEKKSKSKCSAFVTSGDFAPVAVKSAPQSSVFSSSEATRKQSQNFLQLKKD
jgi:hypothetical protein